MSIRLTKEDSLFILSQVEMPEGLRIKLKKNEALNEDEADDLRELCADKLPLVGFNSDYSVNWKGKRLEGLIDK
ncbi:MAG TPA: hypothetical protein DCX27_12305, partial [Balneola sp.]|nr:hypothetical protein [Balneola sp.]